MRVSTTLFGTDAKRVAGTCPDCGQDDLFTFDLARMGEEGVSIIRTVTVCKCKTRPV